MRFFHYFLPLLFVLGCGAEVQQEPKSFTSYDQASSWYHEHAVTDEMSPDSTAIAHAAYCGNSRRLVMLIAFTSRPEKYYIYAGIKPEVWEAFKRSPSKGRFYNSIIKGWYPFKN